MADLPVSDDGENAFDPLPSHLIQKWVKAIRSTKPATSGTHGRATFMIRDFLERNRRGIPQDPAMLVWVGEILGAIIQGSAGNELHSIVGIPPSPKHRHAGQNIDRDVDLATWVLIARSRGYSDATEKASELFGVSLATAHRIVARTTPLVEGRDQEPFASHSAIRLAKLRRPIPPAKKSR